MRLIKIIASMLILSSTAYAGLKDLKTDAELFNGSFLLIDTPDFLNDSSCPARLSSNLEIYDVRKGLSVYVNMHKPYSSKAEQNRVSERTHAKNSFVNASASTEDNNACLGLAITGNAYLGMAILSGTETRMKYKSKKKKLIINKFKIEKCGLLGVSEKSNERAITIDIDKHSDSIIKITKESQSRNTITECNYMRAE